VSDAGASGKRPGQGKAAKDLNELIRYTMWSVYRVVPGAPAPTEDLASIVRQRAERDVVLRGAYDVGGLRGDADLMLWWHAPSAEALQAAYRAVGSAVGQRLAPVWSQMGLHRPAEFNRSHVPAFLADERPRDWVCVYPFVRSYEWYLLEESERRAMLVEHGQMGRDYPDVRANTVAAFALGDYEWLLAFEADELHRIVDLMRHLRGSTARRHVREEIPFYTGRRTSPEDVDALLRG
jgi:peroxiredoxin